MVLELKVIMNTKEEKITSLIKQGKLHQARLEILRPEMQESIPGFCNYSLAVIYSRLRNYQAARYYLSLIKDDSVFHNFK